MAKKQTMMPTMGGGGTGRKVLGTVVCLLLLGLILRDPIGAAHAAQQAGAWIGAVLDALTTFGKAVST